MSLIRGDALTIPLADNTVDLIVTSPPYFALRSYTDEGEHYAGQLGSEATPAAFIDALIGVTRECVRVLKPSGSLFVNLGDKYSGAQAQNIGGENRAGDSARTWAQTNPANTGIRSKSLMGLPWRYALRCIDDLGLILRAEIIWSKPNGLPESVQDRVRRSHENWFHFTVEPRYYSAVDEIREPHARVYTARDYETLAGRVKNRTEAYANTVGNADRYHEGSEFTDPNPLGKLPGSVWTVPTEPLRVPDDLPQHFAAFPSEWPRRIILGWSPSGICCECGEGREPRRGTSCDECGGFRPNNAKSCPECGHVRDWKTGRVQSDEMGSTDWSTAGHGTPRHPGNHQNNSISNGESCACPTPTAPTRPAVVLDPFAGTGTTVAVANHLGRHGIGLDLSADYLRLARWRCQDPGLRAKVLGVDKPTPEVPGQMALL